MSVINQMLRDLDKRQVNHIGTLSFTHMHVPNGQASAAHVSIPRATWKNYRFAASFTGFLLVSAVLLYPYLKTILHGHDKHSWSSQLTLDSGVIANAHANVKNQSAMTAILPVHPPLQPTSTSPNPTQTSALIAAEVEQIRKQIEQENAALIQSKLQEIADMESKLKLAMAAALPSERPVNAEAKSPTISPTGLQHKKTTRPALEAGADAVSALESIAIRRSVEPSPTSSMADESSKMDASKVSIHPHVTPEGASAEAFNQALHLLQSGRSLEAQTWLTKSLTASPYNHDARQTLVAILIQAKQNDEAMALLNAGLKLDPKQTGFRQLLARLQVEAADLNAALATLEEGLADAQDDAQYHAFMAALLQRGERHKEAVNHYLIALKQQTPQANWLVGLGLSLQALGRLPEAKMAYEKAQSTPMNVELSSFVSQRLQQIHEVN